MEKAARRARGGVVLLRPVSSRMVGPNWAHWFSE